MVMIRVFTSISFIIIIMIIGVEVLVHVDGNGIYRRIIIVGIVVDRCGHDGNLFVMTTTTTTSTVMIGMSSVKGTRSGITVARVSMIRVVVVIVPRVNSVLFFRRKKVAFAVVFFFFQLLRMTRTSIGWQLC